MKYILTCFQLFCLILTIILSYRTQHTIKHECEVVALGGKGGSAQGEPGEPGQVRATILIGGGDGPGFIKIVRHKNDGGVSTYSSNIFSGPDIVTGGAGASGKIVARKDGSVKIETWPAGSDGMDASIGTLMPTTGGKTEEIPCRCVNYSDHGGCVCP